MNTRVNRLTSFIIAALLLTSLAGLFWGCQTKPAAGDLEKNFVNPPNSAKPWAYWVWFAGGGRWSKEGATADLEAMKRVGINGVLIMGNPATLSTEWREKFKYSVEEAARLGMEHTRDMVANVGKAKPLGERSLGHPDPGAISMYLILKLMAEYAAQKPGRTEP